MSNEQSPYQQLGGEEKVRELVDRFYDHMDSLEESRGIRVMHAKSLKASREKLFLFLSGWLGGPDLYIQKYGHPMLRRRHMPFQIGQAEAEQWLMCMEKAMDDMAVSGELRAFLSRAFRQTADHMRNLPEAT
jgi:hemoglobin